MGRTVVLCDEWYFFERTWLKWLINIKKRNSLEIVAFDFWRYAAGQKHCSGEPAFPREIEMREKTDHAMR